jgi:hypothetical protein
MATKKKSSKLYAMAFGYDWTDGDSMFVPVFLDCQETDSRQVLLDKWMKDLETDEEDKGEVVGFWILDQKAYLRTVLLRNKHPLFGRDAEIYLARKLLKESTSLEANRIVWTKPKEELLTCDCLSIRLLAKRDFEDAVTKMKPNVRILLRDHRENLSVNDWLKALTEIGSGVVMDNKFQTGNDSIMTVIGPAGDYDYSIGPQLNDLSGYFEKIHSDGMSFWFFDELNKKWLSQTEALVVLAKHVDF